MTQVQTTFSIAEAIAHPSKVYDAPKDVVHDERLSKQQKMKVLESWETDQKQLLVADEENMPLQKPEASNPAEKLQLIVKAKDAL